MGSLQSSVFGPRPTQKRAKTQQSGKAEASRLRQVSSVTSVSPFAQVARPLPTPASAGRNARRSMHYAPCDKGQRSNKHKQNQAARLRQVSSFPKVAPGLDAPRSTQSRAENQSSVSSGQSSVFVHARRPPKSVRTKDGHALRSTQSRAEKHQLGKTEASRLRQVSSVTSIS